MDSRRLVVWISTGILGFQGATLAFDLLNCTAMGWLYVRMNGLPPQAQRIDAAPSKGLLEPGAPQQPSPGLTAELLTSDFCSRSQGRIDAAVPQGLGILAGLALGSSVPGRGADQP
ncbi:hypothetical protein KBY83_07630 [Cyanobium sp. WKJ7-Wakatipu]|uniref:hypothetical protein n=1 Tax=Cyanobium sp. WKJ7-Wakatipu TaxID=2823726 RepID=UPI0020CD3B34|nr:hypothetical protein [Cyanobium sp. WKJ7-Wakatipu]MCP9783193.1 hypothetical protein [Cyanobium sp. WKJ7-Wakatipu]